jgi:DNA-directed RNA polymerase specialized sigma24 family protein
VDDPTSQLRARARAGDADAFGAVFDACAKSVYNHAFRLDDAARVKAVHRALAGLPGLELEVLALCVWFGLGYAEAAEALGVPVGTVRSRLSRAQHPAATPPRGTVMQEIVYAENTDVPGPGDR